MTDEKFQYTELNEAELLSGLKNAVSEERRWTQTMLEYLLECDRRGIHLKLGYPSLHEFAVQYLGLSDGAAHRRIKSMRLMASVPESAEELASGALSLSNAAKLQTFFQAEARNGTALAPEEKLDWVRRSVRMPSRELEREIIREASPGVQVALSERTQILNPDMGEIRLVVPKELLEKIEELKDYLAHALPNSSTATVIERLVDQEIERQRRKRHSNDRTSQVSETLEMKKPSELASGATTIQEPETGDHSASAQKLQTKRIRNIPANIKRAVWTRANGQCEAQNTTSSAAIPPRRCSARRLLQIDHIRPVSQGGANTLENLRLLCAHHNRIRPETDTLPRLSDDRLQPSR